MNQKTVAILLATYNPPENWLCELLDSLNQQTYPSLRLYVRDDASTSMPLSRLEELLQAHITRFPFELRRNEANMGSTDTFGALVEDCNEPYIAFCDQDDVWHPDKIENTFRLLTESPLHPTVVCTNVSIMDGDGNRIAPSIDVHRRRHVFLRGTGLAPQLIYRNFALGCTMLAERERIRSYLPFPKELVHDHYILFRAATEGAIDFLAEPQMRYRVYGGNQTGVMTGVNSKEDYLKRRILVFDERVRCLSEYVSLDELQAAKAWSEARIANFHREKGGFGRLWRLRKLNFVTSLFELVALRLPLPLFRFAIRLVQKGAL